MNATLKHASQRILLSWAAWQRRRYALEIHRALRDLDAHTLQDLGLDRCGIPSLAAEMAGRAVSTRVRSERSPARSRPDHLPAASRLKQAVLPRVIAVAVAAVIALTLLDQVATMGQPPDAGGAVVLARVPHLPPGTHGGTPEERTPAHSSLRHLTGGRT